MCAVVRPHSRAREMRSISERTNRSTIAGKFSSSQVLSMGRISSLTSSSTVRPRRGCAVGRGRRREEAVAPRALSCRRSVGKRPLGRPRSAARRGRCDRLARRIVLHRRHCAQQLRRRGRARRALLFVLGDHSADGSEDLLHRGFLFPRRLRHGVPPHSGRGGLPSRDFGGISALRRSRGTNDTPTMKGKEAPPTWLEVRVLGAAQHAVVRSRPGTATADFLAP